MAWVGLKGVLLAEQHVDVLSVQEDLVPPDLLLLQNAKPDQLL